MRDPVQRRLWVLLALALAAFGVVATTGAGNSAGAPETAATEGCTCHSPEANPAATIEIEGIPDHYIRNTQYNVTLRIAGGAPALPPPAGQNQGGFAIKGDAKWGTLASVDDTTQLAGDEYLTHTEAGNDQREWRFTWTSTDADFQEFEGITFQISANAVNGNGLPDPIDAWTHREPFFEAVHPEEDPFANLDGEGNATAETTDEGNGTPAFTPALLAASIVVASLWFARRRGLP